MYLSTGYKQAFVWEYAWKWLVYEIIISHVGLFKKIEEISIGF